MEGKPFQAMGPEKAVITPRHENKEAHMRQVCSSKFAAGEAGSWYTAILAEIPTDPGWRLTSWICLKHNCTPAAVGMVSVGRLDTSFIISLQNAITA